MFLKRHLYHWLYELSYATCQSGVTAAGIQWKELVAIFDKKERDKEISQMTLAAEMAKYKGLYESTVKEYQQFQTSAQRSISSCKNEVGITVT